jgi:hypothetical protein
MGCMGIDHSRRFRTAPQRVVARDRRKRPEAHRTLASRTSLSGVSRVPARVSIPPLGDQIALFRVIEEDCRVVQPMIFGNRLVPERFFSSGPAHVAQLLHKQFCVRTRFRLCHLKQVEAVFGPYREALSC